MSFFFFLNFFSLQPLQSQAGEAHQAGHCWARSEQPVGRGCPEPPPFTSNMRHAKLPDNWIRNVTFICISAQLLSGHRQELHHGCPSPVSFLDG